MGQFLSNLIAGVRITDVIDILIVTLIIYKVMNFIRETRAQQLVKGLLVLLLMFFLSDIFKLYTLNWILKSTVTMGIIALVIVFQPELRRALEYVGRSKLVKSPWTHVDKEKATVIVEQIVKAVEDMSKSKTGALMVFERQVSLTDVAESGTIIEGRINSSLIENIFFEGSPLHDGAVIIRGEEIYAAGCVLPLTNNKDLNKSLGTRHRAALGITENSDALTVVVSEETGIISIASAGKLQRFLDSKYVEKTLLQLYIPESGDDTVVTKVKKRLGGKDV